MLSCKEAAKLISDALDRRLSLRERLGLRLHLVFCQGCHNFEKQMAFIRRAAGSFVKSVTDDDDRPRG